MNPVDLAFKTLQARLLGKVNIVDVLFAVTMSCNANCSFCHTNRSNKKNLPLEEIKIIIDQFSLNKVSVVCISGGEPLLRKDIADIISYINEKKMTPSIVTNGYIHKEEILKAGVKNVNISLDFPDKRHDLSRKLNNGFEHFMNSVKFYVSKKPLYNHKVFINITVMENNLNDLGKMISIAKDNSCDGVGLSPFIPLSVNGMKKNKKSEIDYHSILTELKRHYGNFITASPMLVNNMHNFLNYPDDPKKQGLFCYSGLIGVFVDPLGNLSPCMMYNEYTSTASKQFNLLKRSMKEIVQSAEYKEELGKIAKKQCSLCLCPNVFEPNILFHPSSYNETLGLIKNKRI